jgi:RNA polymerase sigma factor (sigma-70 family)
VTVAAPAIEDVLRPLVPQVLGVLVRRHGQFEACEDAVQEALLAAAVQWPADGVPDNPRAWLLTVATRRLTDLWRSEHARRRRETASALLDGLDEEAPAPDEGGQAPDADDTLILLFLCCHPKLSPPSQVALTLRAVGGLTTAEIARAFLVPEPTMAQRISRAKRTVAGAGCAMPAEADRGARLGAVLQVLYLVFNEGYTATSGPDLHRPDLTREAVRLVRQLHALLPDDGEVAGLLALMLITEARRPARTRPDGGLVPLAEQDRSRWDRARLAEGIALVEQTMARAPVGPYQLQAAIAAVHGEAARAEDTDWPQIAELYRLLSVVAPGPVVTLNRAVAVGMVEGPQAGLDLLAGLDRDDGPLAGHHRVPAVRAHLLEMAGDAAGARAAYAEAARRTTSGPERRYLEERAARLVAPPSLERSSSD